MVHAIALLVNPTAGKGRGARFAPPALQRLRGAGLDVRELTGRDAQEAADLAKAAVADGVDALVTVGGDGMVHLALQIVAGTTTALGVIPAGTGNDVSRALGLPLDNPVLAADVVRDGRARQVDGVRSGPSWYLGVLGAGFDSLVNERANRMRWPRGPQRYNVAMLAELRTFRPVPFMLELDGERWETEAMLVAVGNGPSYGGGMKVCPGARLDDGLLDVTVVGPISKPQFVRVFPQVYSGAHVSHRAVTVRQAKVVSLAAAGVVAYADGERVGPLPLTCEVVAGAVRVLAPPAT